MKKKILVVLCMFLLVGAFALGGCTNKDHPLNENRIVVDMKGKTVQLPETVGNYANLYSSAVGILGMLDEGFANASILPNLWIYEEKILEIYPDLLDRVITVNKRTVTAEQIIEKGAQVVFWSNQSEELIASLEALGVACVNIEFTNNEELLRVIEIVTDVLGTDEAKRLANEYMKDLDYAKETITQMAKNVSDAEKKTVLFLGATDVLTTYGEPSYEYGWSKHLNINYVFPLDPRVKKVDLTMEQVLEYNPDIIIVEGPVDASIYTDPVWSQLKAVQNNMLIASPYVFDVWPKGGIESIATYYWAFATIYPEYANYNLEEEIQAFYSKYFNYESVSKVLQ